MLGMQSETGTPPPLTRTLELGFKTSVLPLPSFPPPSRTCEVPPHKQAGQAILGLHGRVNEVKRGQDSEVPQHVVHGAEQGFLMEWREGGEGGMDGEHEVNS